MPNALKKINARVKALAKKHPGKKRSTLQKQAGREYRAGKLKGPKRVAAKKVGARKKRKPAAKKARRVIIIAGPKTVARVRRKRRHHAKPKVHRRRRVSGTEGGSNSGLLLGLGIAAAVGLGAYFLTKPAPSSTSLVQTGNYQRDSSASQVVAYATSIGLGVSAVAALIKALNSSSDSQVTAAASNPDAFLASMQMD